MNIDILIANIENQKGEIERLQSEIKDLVQENRELSRELSSMQYRDGDGFFS